MQPASLKRANNICNKCWRNRCNQICNFLLILKGTTCPLKLKQKLEGQASLPILHHINRYISVISNTRKDYTEIMLQISSSPMPSVVVS